MRVEIFICCVHWMASVKRGDRRITHPECVKRVNNRSMYSLSIFRIVQQKDGKFLERDVKLAKEKRMRSLCMLWLLQRVTQIIHGDWRNFLASTSFQASWVVFGSSVPKRRRRSTNSL